ADSRLSVAVQMDVPVLPERHRHHDWRMRVNRGEFREPGNRSWMNRDLIAPRDPDARGGRLPHAIVCEQDRIEHAGRSVLDLDVDRNVTGRGPPSRLLDRVGTDDE